MDKKMTVRRYLSEILTIFGIIVLILNIFCLIFGDEAKNDSTIFTFGSNALAISTMLEFLAAVALIVALRIVFLTDTIIKAAPLSARMILMFASALAVTIGFIFAFGWFPATDIVAWMLFGICFVVSSAISTFIAVFAEKQENQMLEEALTKYKENQ